MLLKEFITICSLQFNQITVQFVVCGILCFTNKVDRSRRQIPCFSLLSWALLAAELHCVHTHLSVLPFLHHCWLCCYWIITLEQFIKQHSLWLTQGNKTCHLLQGSKFQAIWQTDTSTEWNLLQNQIFHARVFFWIWTTIWTGEEWVKCGCGRINEKCI